MNAGVAQWQALIQKASQQTGVPASVIAAVMTVESGGNAQAKNPSGATGLMQIMPSIWGKGKNLYDPWTNVLTGAQILAQNKKAYGSWNESFQRYYGVGNRAVSRSYASKVEQALAGIPQGWGTSAPAPPVAKPQQPLQPIPPLPQYPWSTARPNGTSPAGDGTSPATGTALLSGATAPPPSVKVGQINWQPLSAPRSTADQLLSGATSGGVKWGNLASIFA